MTMPTTTTGYTPSTQSTTLHQRNPADVGGGNTNNKPYEVIDTSKAGQFTGKDYHATTVTTPPHQQTGSASTQNRPDGNNLFIIGGIASMLTACFSFGVMNVAMNARATRLFATSTAFSVAFLVLALSQFALLCYMVSWDYASLGKKRDDYLKDVIILLAFSLICAVVALGTSAREGVEYFYVMHIFAVFCNFVALAYLIGYKYSIENTKAPVYRIGRTPRWIDYVEVFLTVVLAAFVIQLTPTFNSARESSYFDAYVAFLCFLLFGVLMQVIWSFLYFFDYRGMSLLNLKRNLFATSFFNFCMVLIVFPLLGHFWDNGLETPAGIALGAFIASFLHLFWAALQVSDVYDCRCNQYNALNSGSAYQNQSSTMTKREPERSPPVTSEAGRAHLIEGGHVANV